MKKVLFCDNSLRLLLNFREEIIEYYVNHGYGVILVAPIDIDNFSCNSYKVIDIKMSRSGKNPFEDIKYCRTLLSIYKSERPDYIFHYTIKPNIYGAIAAKISGIENCSVITGLGYTFSNNSFSNKIAQLMYRFSLRYANKVVVLNSDIFNTIKNLGVVNHDNLIWFKGGEGINISKYHSQHVRCGDTKTIFLMIGRILYDKGYHEYVEAAKMLKAKYGSSVIIQLLGNIDKNNPMCVPESVIQKDVSDGLIDYLGFADDVKPYMNKVDCIVLPSYHEGLSRVLMEALAMELPIITTDIGGCRETVDNGQNGFLVKPQSVESLFDGMISFYNTTLEKRIEMGKNSLNKARSVFDINKTIDQYRDIFE